jgi:hypothetical protein
MSNVEIFGSTEGEISAEKSIACREIVATILDYGIDQNQILKIIKLLSLELENRIIMKKILESLSENSINNEQKERKIICND